MTSDLAGLQRRSRFEHALVRAFLRAGALTRADLIAATGLSRPTVQTALEGLAAAGLVTADEMSDRPSAGRRPQVYRLSPRAGIAIGVELGRRHIQVIALDGGRRSLVSPDAVQLEASADLEPKLVLRQVASVIGRVHAAAGPELPLLGIGVGVPMPLTLNGKLASRTLLPAWADIDPKQEIEKHLGPIPLHVANDASLGALGEFTFGTRQDLIYIKLGTGVGGGAVIGGKVLRGAAGTACEIGHISVDPRGRPCACGNLGCLERYIGGRALTEAAAAAGISVTGIPDLVRRAKAGDQVCRRLVIEAGQFIGTGLGALLNLLSPGLILLGGSLSAASELLRPSIDMVLEHAAFQPVVGAVTITTSSFGEFASARGGVALAIESYLEASESPG